MSTLKYVPMTICPAMQMSAIVGVKPSANGAGRRRDNSRS